MADHAPTTTARDRVRQQVDLEALTAELLAVAEQTMQPTQESLWLRPPQSTVDRGKHPSWPDSARGGTQ